MTPEQPPVELNEIPDRNSEMVIFDKKLLEEEKARQIAARKKIYVELLTPNRRRESIRAGLDAMEDEELTEFLDSEFNSWWKSLDAKLSRQVPLTIKEIQEMCEKIVNSDEFDVLLAMTEESPSFTSKILDAYFDTFSERFANIGIFHILASLEARKLAKFWFARKLKPEFQEESSQLLYTLIAKIYEAMHRVSTREVPHWEKGEPPYKTVSVFGKQLPIPVFFKTAEGEKVQIGSKVDVQEAKKITTPTPDAVGEDDAILVPLVEIDESQEGKCALVNKEGTLESNDAMERKLLAVEIVEHTRRVQVDGKPIIYLAGDGPAQLARLIIDELEAQGDRETIVVIREYNGGQIQNGLDATNELENKEEYLGRIIWTQGSASDNWEIVFKQAQQAAKHRKLDLENSEVVAAASSYVIGALNGSLEEGFLVENVAKKMWEALSENGAYFGLDFCDPGVQKLDPENSFTKENCTLYEKMLRKMYKLIYERVLKSSLYSCFGLWGHNLGNVRQTTEKLSLLGAKVEGKWHQTVFTYIPLPLSTEKLKMFFPFPGYVSYKWKAVKPTSGS